MADDNPPRAVTVVVTPHLLKKALGLPPDVRITGVAYNSLSQKIVLRLDAPNFPTVIEGGHPMRATLFCNPKTQKITIHL